MNSSPSWVSVAGVAWVIDDAPVPADLFPVLLVIARRADEHGRGSYQSVSTVAEKTGKSPDQVARDIRRLLDLGLIVPGDQSLPERHGVPAGRRPVVYDLVLEVCGPKPRKTSRNPSGRRRRQVPEPPPQDLRPEPEQGAGVGEEPSGVTPGMDAAPPAAGDPSHGCAPSPGMDAGGTPCMDAPPPLCMDAPRTRQENPGRNPSNPARAREVALLRERTDVRPDETGGFLDWVTGRYRPRSLNAYLVALAGRGHLQERLDEWRIVGKPTSHGLADRTVAEAIAESTPAPPFVEGAGPVDRAALLAQVRAIKARKRGERARPTAGRAA
ncbi:helix-turn-helix domain-containing protein [Thermomonospora cellulosilytica]|uniref:Helix-turn-helix domain-containing protein n=1 Tax=Thermomonospora cellulosilytica TaxID=1411118 RepID=A0A7W3N1K6_9ACTN|nr:helix-turn-helix domain-containing protein [Thermomonospora cellulosilytica]MBA9005859.1 hypothetical protein [Thermomonospora cellulosilytica]